MAMRNTWCVGHNPPPCPGGYESWWWSAAWVGDKSGLDVVEMVELSCSALGGRTLWAPRCYAGSRLRPQVLIPTGSFVCQPLVLREAPKCTVIVGSLSWKAAAQAGGVTGVHQLGFRYEDSLCPSAETTEIAAVAPRASPGASVVPKIVLWNPTV